jgi:hypothetical protein
LNRRKNPEEWEPSTGPESVLSKAAYFGMFGCAQIQLENLQNISPVKEHWKTSLKNLFGYLKDNEDDIH